jgi:hypothetical protein
MTFTLEESHLWIAGIVAGSIAYFLMWMYWSRYVYKSFDVPFGQPERTFGLIVSLFLGFFLVPTVFFGYVPWKLVGRHIDRYVRGGQ